MAVSRWLLPVALVLLPVSTAVAGPKAFDVPEDEFFTRVHKVVLAPCKFPGDFSLSDTLMAASDPVKWQIDSLLVAKFSAAGLTVISAREAKSVYDAVVDSLGGLYDPVSGLADTTRFAAAEARTRARLRELHQPDAWVFPVVYRGLASFTNAVASWNGASERISKQSLGKGLFKNLTLRAADQDFSGTVSALSLGVSIDDNDGKSLYSWSGGIHATSRLSDGKFVEIPQGSYFAKPERTTNSVSLALKAMDKAVEKRGKKK